MTWQWQRIVALAVFLAGVHFAGSARAAYSEYIKLAGVTGESHPPGLSDAIHVRSLTIGKNSLTETQLYDTSSPQISIVSNFNDATVAFYKDDPNAATAPFEEIQLQHLLVDTIQVTSFNAQPAESVSFLFQSPATYLYLELPGSGNSTLGRIPIDSLTITDNTFSVHKPIDAASPALAAALLNGAPFPGASLLVYTDPTGAAGPNVSVVFSHVLISAITPDVGGANPGETISFVAQDSTLPEPGVGALLAIGVLVGASRRRVWGS